MQEAAGIADGLCFWTSNNQLKARTPESFAGFVPICPPAALRPRNPAASRCRARAVRPAGGRLEVFHHGEVLLGALPAGRTWCRPGNTLARNAPPGFITSQANSAAASTSAMILRWSVGRCPSSCSPPCRTSRHLRRPPSSWSRALSFAGASGSRKSSSRTRPRDRRNIEDIDGGRCGTPPFSTPTRFAATCDHPPGAAPGLPPCRRA